MHKKRRSPKAAAAVRGQLAVAVLRGRRKTLHKMQKGKCYFCERSVTLERATIDHLTPKSCGGTSDMTNIVMSCEPCNRLKGTRTADEFRGAMTLRPRDEVS